MGTVRSVGGARRGGVTGRRLMSLPGRALRAARKRVGGLLGCTAFGTITSVETPHDVAALTFDDGPDPHWTPKVLDLLEAYGAKGTFFVVGQQVAAHPEVMERLRDGGHALGNHTYAHPRFPLISSRDRRRELQACAEALAPYLSGASRRLFRPPYLAQSLRSRFDSWWSGYDVIACSLHAKDWEERPARAMAEDLTAVGRGDIVMLHDAMAGEGAGDREPMLGALETLLRDGGPMRFVTVPDLLESGVPRREIWLQGASGA
jgi:peptidoglycan-N-acetylglucosamine deacetylase